MVSRIVSRPVDLHPKQSEFIRSEKLYRGFVGGRGAGKTRAGAIDLVWRSKANRTYLIASPTSILMNDTTFSTFRTVAEGMGMWYSYRLTPYPTVTLANGAKVRFRTAEDPERMRGPNLSGVWLDEASLMEEEAYSVCIASLRECGESGWLSATFTPRGYGHWTYKVFAKEPRHPDTAIFESPTRNNPFLPPSFDASVRAQYRDGSRMALQELDAVFLPDGIAMFARHWFKILPVAPKLKRRVRAWDLAATEVKAGNDPDYTVGALVGETEDKQTVITHIVRDRLSPLETKRLIRSIAEYDGKGVEILIEQEPGASAKILVSDLIRDMAGWTVRAKPANGTKSERAAPLSSLCEAGAVALVASPWNEPFLDEAEQFPGGTHDDQIDAVALGFNHLHEKKPLEWGVR